MWHAAKRTVTVCSLNGPSDIYSVIRRVGKEYRGLLILRSHSPGTEELGAGRKWGSGCGGVRIGWEAWRKEINGEGEVVDIPVNVY
jgi:hypothetical protein